MPLLMLRIQVNPVLLLYNTGGICFAYDIKVMAYNHVKAFKCDRFILA